MTFWEYKVIDLVLEVDRRRHQSQITDESAIDASIEGVLNDFGEQRWELVSIQTLVHREGGRPRSIAYLKRPKIVTEP
jgi:hypothetical protein